MATSQELVSYVQNLCPYHLSGFQFLKPVNVAKSGIRSLAAMAAAGMTFAECYNHFSDHKTQCKSYANGYEY